MDVTNSTVQAAQNQVRLLESEKAQIITRQGLDAARLQIIDAQLTALQPLLTPPAPAPSAN